MAGKRGLRHVGKHEVRLARHPERSRRRSRGWLGDCYRDAFEGARARRSIGRAGLGCEEEDKGSDNRTDGHEGVET